jgi:COMPASS component SWD3
MLTEDITKEPSLKQKAVDLIFTFLEDNQAEYPQTFEAFKQESSPRESSMNLISLLAGMKIKPAPRKVHSSLYEIFFNEQELIRIDGVGKATCICDSNSGILVGCTDRNIYKVEKSAVLLLSLQSPVLSLSFNKEKGFGLATSMDGKAVIFDGVGKKIQELKQHSAYCAKSAISKCSEFVVTGSHDKSVLIYKRDQGSYNLVKTLNMIGIVEALVIHDTTAIIGVRGDNYLHYFDLVNLCDKPVNMNENGDDWVSFSPMDVKVSPDAKFVAVYTDSIAGRVIILNYGTNEILSNCFGMEIDAFSLPRLEFVSEEHLACTNFSSVDIFDIYSGKVVDTLKCHTDVIRGLLVSESLLTTCSFDSTIAMLSFSKFKN